MKEIEIVLKENEDLESVLLMNKHKISVHLAKMVVWALENNMDKFTFANILVEGEEQGEFHLGCSRGEYLEALKKQKVNLIEFEEYEMLEKLDEWIAFLELETIIEDPKNLKW